MNVKSKRQQRWMNSPAGKKALGQKEVDLQNAKIKGKKLPESATDKEKAISAGHKSSMSKRHSSRKSY